MKMLWKSLNKNGFIYDYMKYMESFSTSSVTDFWSGVWLVSLFCNKNVIIDRPSNPLYCNFYINLLSDNEISRNLSINILKNLYYKINNTYPIITDSLTLENFNKFIKAYNTKYKKVLLNFVFPNFSKYIYKKGFTNLLDDLYYNKKERIKYDYSSSNINTSDCYTSIFTYNTLANYLEITQYDKFGNGLSTKLLTIFEGKIKNKIGWGDNKEIPQELVKKGKELIRRFNKRRKIVLSTEAIRRYNQWYKYRRIEDSLISKLYETNEPDIILKLATILTIDNNLEEVSEEILNNSILIITTLKRELYSILNKEISENSNDKYERIIKNIQKYLKLNSINGITHTNLYQKVRRFCTVDEFKYIISILHELELIEIFMIENRKGYIYKITNTFYSSNCLSDIKKLLKN